MSEAKKGNKVLLYYNAYSGSGVFKNNLDYIVERCQEEGFQVVPVRVSLRLGETGLSISASTP